MQPLHGSPTGLPRTFNCSTFIQPVRQPVALRWSPRMTRLSHQVPPRRLFIGNPGIRRCTASFAATLTGAVCAISCPNQSVKARSDESKRHSALQVPQGRAFGLRLPLVYPFSSCLPWTRGRSLCLISVIVIKLTFLVLSEL